MLLLEFLGFKPKLWINIQRLYFYLFFIVYYLCFIPCRSKVRYKVWYLGFIPEVRFNEQRLHLKLNLVFWLHTQ